jgi:hypothetical protein
MHWGKVISMMLRIELQYFRRTNRPVDSKICLGSLVHVYELPKDGGVVVLIEVVTRLEENMAPILPADIFWF